jgi:serine/threonine-protein kinase RsbT
MRQVRIEHQADVIAAQQAARQEAAEVGFSRSACAELMIVASELASNMLKHAGRGRLCVERIYGPERGAGIRLVAEDQGPHFKSFETALRDGHDDEGPVDLSMLVVRRGTASGLGAVQRMTDELTWEPRGVGKVVIAIRYVVNRSRRALFPGA